MRPDPLPGRLIEAYAAPRRSMRRGLDENWTERQRLLLVAAGAVIELIPLRMFIYFGVADELFAKIHAESAGLFYGAFAIAVVIQYGIVSALSCALGRVFGGKASLAECRSAVAWWGLATAFLAPFAMGPAVTPSLAALFMSMWMFAAFLSEAHGFSGSGKAAALAAVSFLAIMLVIGAFLGGVVSGAP